MKIPCAVARDLMSLEGDGRYAEETRLILRRHLDECPDCARIRADMEKPVAVEPVSQAESAAFRESAKKLRRRNPLRMGLEAAGLLLAAIILVALGVNGYWQLTCSNFDVPMEQYDFELFQTENGQVYGSFQFKEGVKPTTTSICWVHPDRDGVLQIEYNKPVIETDKWRAERPRGHTNWLYLSFIDGKLCYYLDEDLQTTVEVKEIRLGYRNRKDYRVIWREGQEIPMGQEID